MAAAARSSTPRRNPRLAKVHIACKELGLDEATYRAVLERVTGKTSAGQCTDAELDRVLEDFKAKGWKPALQRGAGYRKPTGSAWQANRAAAARRPRPPAENLYAKKARALWLSLHDLGVVRDAGEPALEAFARRQLKVDAMRWADEGQTYRLIEALKAMANRAGWNQYLGGIPPRNAVRELLRRLALRQAKILAAGGVEHPPIGDLADGQIEDLRPLIANMGVQIRKLPAPADPEAAA